MSETSSTTLSVSQPDTGPTTVSTSGQQQQQTDNQQSNEQFILNHHQQQNDNDDDEYEIEYEYEDDDDDVDGDQNMIHQSNLDDDDDEEYCRIADRIDELLNKTNNLRTEVQAPKSLLTNIPDRTESSHSASIDDENNDEEYDYEYEYDDEDETGGSRSPDITSSSQSKDNEIPATKLSEISPKTSKDLPASEAITQAPYQERLPDFGQLRHASNKWNIAAISGEDAETSFDPEDDEECNEIEIALEEPGAKIVGQLEQLLEEDEQDDVDELMPDALIQQTTPSNPLLLGSIDLPTTPSPAASPQPNDSPSQANVVGDLLYQIRNAALNNELNNFRSLLDSNPGFFIDAILKAGWTALMYGSYRANVDIVHECLLRGADPNYHKEYFTPLMAVCCSRMEGSEYLLQQQSFIGCNARMLETLRLLIDAGGSVHSQDRFGCTALQYAARFGRRSLVVALLDAGASIDATNCNGWTALHWAAAEGHGDVVETLINRGANPNQKATGPELELSPGELAAMKGQEEISDYILNASFINSDNNKHPLSPATVVHSVGNDDVSPLNEHYEPNMSFTDDKPGAELTMRHESNADKDNQCELKVQNQYENGAELVLPEAKETQNMDIQEFIQDSVEAIVHGEDQKVELSLHNDKLDLRIESEVADNLLQLAIDSANFELSLKQMQDDANNALLSGPELRKRTTLVIDEWDEDTKRILASQTQIQRRKSSTIEGLTDPKSLIFSLIIAAALFLLFRYIFGAIFS